MEMNQMAAPLVRMARPGSSWRESILEAVSAQAAIIRKTGRATAETGMGPSREKRLERTASHPEPSPQPGMPAPRNDCTSKNAAKAAASAESAATRAYG